jgi:hypothetical protein
VQPTQLYYHEQGRGAGSSSAAAVGGFRAALQPYPTLAMMAAADEDPWSYPELPTAAAAAAASAMPTQHGQELRFGNMKIKVCPLETCCIMRYNRQLVIHLSLQFVVILHSMALDSALLY